MLARTSDERKAWTALLSELGPSAGYGAQKPTYLTLGEYQAPPLEPKDGFTMDRALVYAIVRVLYPDLTHADAAEVVVPSEASSASAARVHSNAVQAAWDSGPTRGSGPIGRRLRLRANLRR